MQMRASNSQQPAIGGSEPVQLAACIASPPQGPLIGEGSSDGAVEIYRGIPYAEPPIGVRRWRQAEPAPDWVAPRAAVRFSPTCMQITMPPVTRMPDGSEQPTFYWEAAQLPSEDCLYLNVWAPADHPKGSERARPVMVWLHGGGLIVGSGSSEFFDGEALARKGVVIVTLNYRLGIFGFFAHPELSRESAAGVSGNYGIGDQIEALRWIRRNIAAFGGDPDNVTIFGESAGSSSVSLLMGTPLSKGLFHKAIGQSGAYFYPMLDLREPTMGRVSAEEAGSRFCQGVVADGGVAALRDLSAAGLQSKAEALGAVNPAQLAIVDGHMFDAPLYRIFAEGRQHAVPVIVGFNSDEGSGLSDYYVVPPPPESPESYIAQAHAKFGDLALDFLRLYPPSDLTGAVFDSFRDSEFGWKMQAWAGFMASVAAPAHLYFFSKTPSHGDILRGMPNSAARRKFGAHHAAEIAYVFNHPEKTPVASPPPSPADCRLADLISDYWVEFARSGDPNGVGRPLWAAYEDAKRGYIEFGDAVRAGENLLPGTLELHLEIQERRIRRGIPWDGTTAGFAATIVGRD